MERREIFPLTPDASRLTNKTTFPFSLFIFTPYTQKKSVRNRFEAAERFNEAVRKAINRMPGAVVKAGLAEKILPLSYVVPEIDRIAEASLLSWMTIVQGRGDRP